MFNFTRIRCLLKTFSLKTFLFVYTEIFSMHLVEKICALLDLRHDRTIVV